MSDFTDMKLVDLLVYAPYLLGSVFGLFIVWKLGKFGLRLSRAAASTPAKTAGALGALASLFATPTAYSWLIETGQWGMAVGAAGAGAFTLAVSLWALRSGRSVRDAEASQLVEQSVSLATLRRRLKSMQTLLEQGTRDDIEAARALIVKSRRDLA